MREQKEGMNVRVMEGVLDSALERTHAHKALNLSFVSVYLQVKPNNQTNK